MIQFTLIQQFNNCNQNIIFAGIRYYGCYNKLQYIPFKGIAVQYSITVEIAFK